MLVMTQPSGADEFYVDFGQASNGAALPEPMALQVHVPRAWRCTLNWDQIEGKWKQLKGEMKTRWGKLTDSDWDSIDGQKDKFLGKLQERYGYSREQAEKDFDEWDDTRPVTEPKTRTSGGY
jgi:uncharacterized protein YjbJ (UPF0337 family)